MTNEATAPKYGTREYDLWVDGAKAEARHLRAKIGQQEDRKAGFDYLLNLAESRPNASMRTLVQSVVDVFDLPVKRRRRWPTVTLRFAWYDLWIGAYVDTAKRTLYVCPLPCILVTITSGKGR